MAGIQILHIFLQLPLNPAVAIGLPLSLGMLSGSSTAAVVRSPWYQNLRAPPGRPPRQVFPIVWPILYIAMGYASHIVAETLNSPVPVSNLCLGLVLYYSQLALNLVWSPIFFGVKKLGIALCDSILLAGTTYYMTKLLDEPTNHKTTYLLVPYCAWLTFALYLTAGFWWLNRKPRSGVKKN
ncbi:TspO/MBR-related protein [Fistulina hepatica ATCC 64428]|nr:TspO/MBR-related protein [Fistulina hepatica ATCC 64428]